jgi:hypothetical protein
VGEITEHIAYGRALWMKNIQAESAAALEPLLAWDTPSDPPRTGAEVLTGLDKSWARLSAYLMRGSADDEYSEADGERLYMMWGMIDHDLPHGGEISLILGPTGYPGWICSPGLYSCSGSRLAPAPLRSTPVWRLRHSPLFA